MILNIRESLNRLDLQTDNKYDLRNTYDCSNISDDKKKKLAEALNKNASAKTISRILDESYGGYDYYLIEFFVDGRRYEEEYTDTSAKEALERFKEDYSDDDYKIREIYKLTNEGYIGLGYPFIHKNESLKEDLDEEQLYKVVISSGATKRNFESALYEDEAEEIVEYYGGRWIDERGFEWSMEIEEDDESTERVYPFDESLNEAASKPDFVVGFYAGQVDDETLELINPEKLVEVNVSADELKERYGKEAEKLLNDYTVQTADRLKNSSGMLQQMILQTAEQKAIYAHRLFSKFDEVKDRLGSNTYMDRKIEEINYPFRDGIKDLSKKLGKMLLPKRENLTEDVYDEESDFDDGEVEEGDTFIEDGRTWSWIERIAGPIHLDFDNWAVWSARDWDYIEEKVKPLLINKEEFNVEVLTKIYDEAEVAYFVVDEDTGFIDWGPVETSTEAQDFLNGKVEDYENDEEYEEIEIEEESLTESINQNDVFKFLDEIKDTVSSFKNRVQEVSEYFDISEDEAEDFVYDWEQENSLTESRAIRNDGDYEVTLHYDDIGDGKEYDYKLGYDEVVDYLREIAWSNGDGPEDANEDEYLEWVMDNFDELSDRYESNVLNYFESEASQYEYDHRNDEP